MPSTPLNPSYICSSDVESIYLDKLDGKPLSAGVVNFFIDGSNTPKEVFQTTGSPPTGFVSLGTSVTLNSIGGYQDGSGNSIALYYFPYDTNGDLELYSVQVFNSGGTPQETREAWPPLASNLAPSTNSDTAVANLNYIPNGQFLSHNDHIITDPVNISPNTISEIAQGGWSFKESAGGSGVYTIAFIPESVNNFSAGLDDAPPFAVQINGNSGSETVRDLVVQWPNVNTFSNSTGLTNTYNLLIAGASLNNTSQTFEVNLISNFGAGGTGEVETLIGNVTLPAKLSPSYDYFNLAVTMPNNATKIANPGNFVAIAIRLPTGQTSAKFTDFALTVNSNLKRSSYPVQTPAQSLSEGVAGWMPTPDPAGMDLYLPLVLTQQGMIFDQSVIGKIVTSLSPIPQNNELAMDGSIYLSSGYSSIGIPYSRLANFLFSITPITATTPIYPANSTPLMGTGVNFVTIGGVTAQPTQFQLVTNTAGGADPVASGAISNTSGSNPTYLLTVNTVPTASYFWTFTGYTSVGPVSKVYNVYYTVNGIGTAPSPPSGANILVALVTGDTTATTVLKTQLAINQYQFSLFNIAGYFLRALDLTTTIDTDSATRSLAALGIIGANIGSTELAAFLSHLHAAGTLAVSPSTLAVVIGSTGAGTQGTINQTTPQAVTITGSTANTGGTETRPVNFAVNYFIKY